MPEFILVRFLEKRFAAQRQNDRVRKPLIQARGGGKIEI